MRFRVRIAMLLVPAFVACGGGSALKGLSPSPSASLEPEPLPPASAVKIAMDQPNFIALSDDAVWVTQSATDRVARVDPATNRITASVAVGHSPAAIAYGFVRLWVANVDDASMSVLDARSNRVLMTIELAGSPSNVAVGAGFVWVASTAEGAVYQLNGLTGKVERTIQIGATEDVVANDTAVWASGPGTAKVSRIDPATGSVTATIDVPGGVHSLALGEGSLWAGSGPNGDAVTRIDTTSNSVTATIKTESGSFPDRIAFTPDNVWTGEYRRNAVLRIDPTTNTIATRIAVAAGPAVVATGFSSLWVANYLADSLWRIPL